MAGLIPNQVIDEIRNRIDIVDVVSGYVTLKPRSGRYWGLCPFHNEKTPSFSVTRDKNIYYCFGCHKGGDAINFLMEIDKLTFVEAVKEAGRQCGVEVVTEREENPEAAGFRASLKELYSRVALSFHHILQNGPRAARAREYLAARGITTATLSAFKLGYAPGERNWLYNFLRSKHYSAQFLAESGLFRIKNGSIGAYFFDRIIFPITDRRGETVAFGGRTMADIQPKYLNSPETAIYKKSVHLYGLAHSLETIRREQTFYLVEGYIDVLAMHQAGLTNTIAPLGTALTENQVKLLRRYAGRGILIFDGDEAGQQATVKAITLMEQAGIEAEVVALPEKSDPADILQKDGLNSLNKLLKCSINSFEYLVKKACAKYNSKTPGGKENIVAYLNDFLASVTSDVKLQGYLTQLADLLQIEGLSARHQILKNKKISFQNEIVQNDSLNITEELALMLAIAVNRDFFVEIRKYFNTDSFQDAAARELFIALEECYREDTNSLESLLEKVDSEILKNVILEKNSTPEFTINPEKIIYDGLYRMKMRILERRRQEISVMLKKYEKTEPWKLKDLLVEKMVLDKEIEELKVRGNAGT